MFKNTRPVPSPAALKVLYQLAYISSGTAVGLGTLCAEERRRRVQIVQRIADNAKTLRQHPRHIQNAAVAVDDGGDKGFFGQTSTLESRSRRQRKRVDASQHSNDSSSGALKGPYLPSVIESEYAATFGSNHKRVGQRRKGMSDKPAVMPSHEASENYKPPLSRSENRRSSNHSSKLNVVGSQHDYSDFKTVPFFRKALYPPTAGHQQQSSYEAIKRRALSSPSAAYLTKPAWNDDTPTRTFESEPDESRLEIASVPAEDITHDVDLFFEHGPPAVAEVARSTARQLLRLALKKGSLEDIRSLCLWLLGTGSFTVHHGHRLVDACQDLTHRMDHQDLFDFYASIFAGWTYRGILDPLETLKQRMQVLIIASTWELDLTLEVITRAFFVKSLQSMHIENLIRDLTAECKVLLSNGQASLAADILLAFAKGRNQPQDSRRRGYFVPLADITIDATLDDGNLAPCQKLLLWKFRLPNEEKVLPRQLNAFVKACGEHNMYALLVDFLLKLGPPTQLEKLTSMADEPSKAILAIACSTDNRLTKHFDYIYRQTREQYRLHLTESSTLMSLHAKWKATRNLETIENELSVITNRIHEKGGPDSLQKLDETLLEIYIDAGKFDRALATISKLNGVKEAGSVAFALTATLIAKKGKWHDLLRLLDIAQTSMSFKFDSKSTRLSNMVIDMYSQHHTARESWDFVTDAMYKLGFSPNVPTTQIVLKCFVARNSIELIPQWLSFLKSLGHRVVLDARVAYQLLLQFYLDSRPSHVNMFWICRTLTLAVPSFHPDHFVSLLKEAIGYDLRQLFGYNARYLRPHAYKRLRRLDGVKGYIPQPGWNWFGRLRFSDDDEMRRFARVVNTAKRATFTSESEVEAQGSHSEHGDDRHMVSSSGVTTGSERSSNQSGALESRQLLKQPPQPQGLPMRARTEVDLLRKDDGTDLLSSSGDSRPSRNIENMQVQVIPWSSTSVQSVAQPVSAAWSDEGEIEGQTTVSSNTDQSRHALPMDGHPHDVAEERYYRLIEVFNENGITPTKDGSTASDEDIDDASVDFRHLRSDFQERHLVEYGSEDVSIQIGHQNVERNMILAMSAAQYDQVLELYHKSRDAIGLPASVRTLEVAVEASLRLHYGEKAHAEELLAAARDAGMNVTCALGPILIHQIKHLNVTSKQEVNDLRVTVIDYYRMNDENGWQVQHHVGVTAAAKLIRSMYPAHGLNILSAIYRSEWAERRPLDLAAMTVFLKGYKSLQSLVGIRWVVKKVLAENLRISAKFMFELRDTYRRRTRPWLYRRRASITPYVEQCRQRRLKQMSEAQNLGSRLVDCIARYRNETSLNTSKTLAPSVARSLDDESTEYLATTPRGYRRFGSRRSRMFNPRRNDFPRRSSVKRHHRFANRGLVSVAHLRRVRRNKAARTLIDRDDQVTSQEDFAGLKRITFSPYRSNMGRPNQQSAAQDNATTYTPYLSSPHQPTSGEVRQSIDLLDTVQNRPAVYTPFS